MLLLRNSLKVVIFEPEAEVGPFCNMPSFDDFRISRGDDSVSGVKAISQSTYLGEIHWQAECKA